MSVVLVIEDDPDIRALITRRIAKSGIEVISAGTGEQGLELAASHRPDLIVLDIRLPGISGWQVIERLNADELLKEIPVLIASIVDPSEVDPTDESQEPVTVHLVKPIPRGQLEAAVHEALNK